MQHSIASFKLGASHFFFSIFTLCVCVPFSHPLILSCFVYMSFFHLSLSISLIHVISVVQSHHSKLKIPRVGEQITIIPTYVLNAREFYGQLGSNFQALHYSQQRLNYRQLHFENEQYSQSAVPGTPLQASLVWVFLCVVDVVVVVASIHCCIL